MLARSIEPVKLNEVAGLVKQAASVIDQMLVLNTSIDLAATSAVAHYRSEARAAEEAADRLVSGSRALESDREQVIASLSSRVEELESLIAKQKSEIEALRVMLWPKSAGAPGGMPPSDRYQR